MAESAQIEELLRARDALIHYAQTLEEERSGDRCFAKLTALEGVVKRFHTKRAAAAFRKWTVFTALAASVPVQVAIAKQPSMDKVRVCCGAPTGARNAG